MNNSKNDGPGIYEVYAYSDVNTGWGKAYTATYIKADSLSDAKDKAKADNYNFTGFGVQKISDYDIAKIKTSIQKRIDHYTKLLSTLKKIS